MLQAGSIDKLKKKSGFYFEQNLTAFLFVFDRWFYYLEFFLLSAWRQPQRNGGFDEERDGFRGRMAAGP